MRYLDKYDIFDDIVNRVYPKVDIVKESIAYSDRKYYFSTDKFDYCVTVYLNEEVPSIGFRAKQKNQSDFYYDQNIITNDNIYLVMNNIIDVIEKDSDKYNRNKYTISTYSTRKGKQRMAFYQKLLVKNGWTIEPTEYPTYFMISKQ